MNTITNACRHVFVVSLTPFYSQTTSTDWETFKEERGAALKKEDPDKYDNAVSANPTKAQQNLLNQLTTEFVDLEKKKKKEKEERKKGKGKTEREVGGDSEVHEEMEGDAEEEELDE